MTETKTCAICWEDIGEKNKSVMNCGHSFHFSCITSNILKGAGDHSMNCPLCRELIVDEEFADCCVEIIPDDDTSSMPELEEEEEGASLWRGSQMWRRDLCVRDRVKMEVEMDTTGEMLNRMGWDLNDDDIITTRYDEYEDSRAFIFCSVVCVIDDPLPGMAPFLLKPIDGRNRLRLQAYQPKQSEVVDIEFLSAEWRNEPTQFERLEHVGDRLEQAFQSSPSYIMNALRKQQILKRQLHDAPICELTHLISRKISGIVLKNETYSDTSVKSMIHKVAMDIIMDHKRRQTDDLRTISLETFDDLTLE